MNRDSQARMTNDETRRNDQIRMTKPATAQLGAIGHSGFGFLSSLVIGHWSLVIQRLTHIRFMAPMRAKKASGLSTHEPEQGRQVLDCASPLALFRESNSQLY